MTMTHGKTTGELIEWARVQYTMLRSCDLSIADRAAHAFEATMTELAARALDGERLAHNFIRECEYERESEAR